MFLLRTALKDARWISISSYRPISTSSTVAFSTLRPSAAGADLLSGLLSKPGPKKTRPAPKMFNPQLRPRPAASKPSSAELTRAFNEPIREAYKLFVRASNNNVCLFFTDSQGKVVKDGRVTAGMMGFKKMHRSQFDAGFRCAVEMVQRMSKIALEKRQKVMRPLLSLELDDGARVEEKWEPAMQIEVIFVGFGQGRDAMFQALLTSEGDVVRPLITRISDRTPIKVGGTRSKKARRL
ncbi:hypothetical protein FRB99_003505 [Tulasnella sp. 403]|nr:hypothetical protein FRB99_003505 [Tulasnella sp. 403]